MTNKNLGHKLLIQIVTTVARGSIGFLVFFKGFKVAKFLLHKTDSHALKIIITFALFALLMWGTVAILELFVNIPAYIVHVRRGCDPEPIIRMRLVDIIPTNVRNTDLTIGTDDRWRIRDITDTVHQHIGKK